MELVFIILILSVLVTFGVLLFQSPQLFARWKRSKRQTSRVLTEDALKHLHDCEYRGIPCTLESVAGTLTISSDDAAQLVKQLEAMELITREGRALTLTAEGRSYALRVIRIHRLWERYLADETAVGEEHWHAEAEQKEHLITPDEADDLARRLGQPVYDPHGDPIPTPAGAVPKPKGESLTLLKAGEVARIVHLEDEPEAVYAQLVAGGLVPGMQVRVIENTGTRVVVEAAGNDVVLAPVVAANVSVQPLKARKADEVSMETLASLQQGESATVVGISSGLRGIQRRRLMDLGIVPGTVVSIELRSPLGDPVAYNIRGAMIALRRQQAAMVLIKERRIPANEHVFPRRRNIL